MLERHRRRIAVEGLAVREASFAPSITGGGARRRGRAELGPVEQGELLQQRRPLAPGAGLNTVQPPKPSEAGASYVAEKPARSSPESTPACAVPELSTAGTPTAATIASATHPRYQASRAASIRASRP